MKNQKKKKSLEVSRSPSEVPQKSLRSPSEVPQKSVGSPSEVLQKSVRSVRSVFTRVVRIEGGISRSTCIGRNQLCNVRHQHFGDVG
jgi:hypothetical protein